MVLLHGQDVVTSINVQIMTPVGSSCSCSSCCACSSSIFSVEVEGRREIRRTPTTHDPCTMMREGSCCLPVRSKKCRQINNNMFVSLFLLFKPLPPWPTQPSNCIAPLILRLLLRHQNFDCCSSHHCQMSNDQLHPTTLRSFQMVS